MEIDMDPVALTTMGPSAPNATDAANTAPPIDVGSQVVHTQVKNNTVHTVATADVPASHALVLTETLDEKEMSILDSIPLMSDMDHAIDLGQHAPTNDNAAAIDLGQHAPANAAAGVGMGGGGGGINTASTAGHPVADGPWGSEVLETWVRVFWPTDGVWYEAEVRGYREEDGLHQLWYKVDGQVW